MVSIKYGFGYKVAKVLRSWRILLFLWVAALLARVIFYKLFLTSNPCLLMYDSGHYHTMAVHLVEHGAFVNAEGIHDFYRMPGYPLFLAGCYKIFGIIPQAALAVQVLLAAVMPVQVFLLMQSIGNAIGLTDLFVKRLSLTVALLAVVHPGALIFSGLLMTDMLFTLFFLFFLHLLVVAWYKHSWQLMLLAGLVLGWCNMIRPLIFLPWCIVGLVFLLVHGVWQRRLVLATSFLLGWSVFIVAWFLRNWLITGLWFLHTLSGPHILNHGATRVYAMAHQVTHSAAQEALSVRLQPVRVCDMEQQIILTAWEQERVAQRMLFTHLSQTLQLGMVNCFKTVAGLYVAELLMIDAEGQLPPYDGSCNLIDRAKRFICPAVQNKCIRIVCWFEMLWQLLLLLGLAGFFVRCWHLLSKQRLLLLLFGICICMVATTAICGFARLRLPIESILTMVSVLFYLVGARIKGNSV